MKDFERELSTSKQFSMAKSISLDSDISYSLGELSCLMKDECLHSEFIDRTPYFELMTNQF